MKSVVKTSVVKLPDVKLTNTHKVFFPEANFTKGDLIAYYIAAAPYLLPHLRNRPVTVIRFPDGITGEKFYEKNAPSFAPPWIKTAPVARQSGGTINYIVVQDARILAWCANLAAIELHPFLHRISQLDRPTHVVFDLDPGEGADLVHCARVAFLLRDLFSALGLTAFPKVSGSKGLQLYVPLNTAVTYATTGMFAKAVAEYLERAHPDLIVSRMTKVHRRGRVLIDWSQNSASKTTVAVYSVRGKREQPFVSMPVTWDELQRVARTKKTAPLFFTPDAALRRLKQKGDLFADVLTLKQKLPKAFLLQAAAADRATPAVPPESSRQGEAKPGSPRRSAVKSGSPRRSAAKPGGTASSSRPGSKPETEEERESSVRRVRRGKPPQSLASYAAKRDFKLTAEPVPGRVPKAKAGSAPRFVIQKHAASHLHYDFRLEMDGTLKSWAVPKGVPTDLGVKRAAFAVEDHPLNYMRFEGIIPQGQYGGGTVMVWDIGTYELLGGSYDSGQLKLRLLGKKLNGEWHLFRIRSEEEKEMWLIVKSGEAAKPITPRQDDRSVLTGRSMARIASDRSATWQSK